MTLFYSLCVISLIAFAVNYFIWSSWKKDKVNLEKDWQKFLKSELLNDRKGIVENGEKLIWNKHLTKEQLQSIITIVNSNINKYPELEELKNLAFNKELNYKRRRQQ